MLKKALLNALVLYKIELYSKGDSTLSIELNKIDDCQKYINDGNEINGTWMSNNQSILLKAIKNAIESKKLNGETTDEEYRDLNKCIIFYNNLYQNSDNEF